MVPHLLDDALLRLLHALDHLVARRAAREPVALRQHRSLVRDLADVAGEDVGLQKVLHHLLGGQPFGKRDLVLHHLVADERVEHVMQARMPGELVFAEAKLLVVLGEQRAGDEGQGVLDDALLDQEIGDVADAVARRNVDDLVGVERPGRVEPMLAHREADAEQDRHDDEDREDGIARDHHGVARALRPFGRHRDPFRLERGARTARRRPPRVTSCGARSIARARKRAARADRARKSRQCCCSYPPPAAFRSQQIPTTRHPL